MSRLQLTRFAGDVDPIDGPRCPHCGADVEGIATSFEPDDPHYGADADGRRGIHLPGAGLMIDRAPEACEHCGAQLSVVAEGNAIVVYWTDEEAYGERAEAERQARVLEEARVHEAYVLAESGGC